MITVSVKSEFDAFARGLNRVAREQLPFAFAQALTRTAKTAGEEFTREMPDRIKDPTPFTLRAVAVKGARKRDLRAVVFIRPIQAKYLSLLERGGERLPKNKAVVNPAHAGVNRYGNLPKRQIKRLLERRDTFVGNINGTAGIWQRNKKTGLRIMARFDDGNRVEPKLHFHKTVLAVARREILLQAGTALRAALATVRRG